MSSNAPGADQDVATVTQLHSRLDAKARQSRPDLAIAVVIAAAVIGLLVWRARR